MNDKNITVAEEKLQSFLKSSLKLMGKEIALPSNYYFCINYIADNADDNEEVNSYKIQYGYPQSGSVYVEFYCSINEGVIKIKKYSVHAPRPEDNMTSSAFANIVANQEVKDIPGLSISFHFGADINTEEYKTLEDINKHPNALDMLTTAITDLNQAEVLGECRLNVPTGSEYIPVTNSVIRKPKQM